MHAPTEIYTTCFAFLLVIVAVSLGWMHLSIRAMERAAGELLERYGLDGTDPDYGGQLSELDTYLAVFGQEHRDYQRLGLAGLEAMTARGVPGAR